MITLAGAPNASAAALAGLQQAMLGAGHSIAALSSGETPAAPAPPTAGALAPTTATPSATDEQSGVAGKLLNEHA